MNGLPQKGLPGFFPFSRLNFWEIGLSGQPHAAAAQRVPLPSSPKNLHPGDCGRCGYVCSVPASHTLQRARRPRRGRFGSALRTGFHRLRAQPGGSARLWVFGRNPFNMRSIPVQMPPTYHSGHHGHYCYYYCYYCCYCYCYC